MAGLGAMPQASGHTFSRSVSPTLLKDVRNKNSRGQIVTMMQTTKPRHRNDPTIWACASGGTQVYGFSSGWKGSQLQSSSDSVLGQGSSYGYDELNRLTSRTVTSGTVQNLSWVYDRWGNRTQQNVTSGCASPKFDPGAKWGCGITEQT